MTKNLPSPTGAPASKSLLFMMIGLTCGLSLLLSAGLITASSVILAMRLRASSDKATVRTPIGEFRLEKATEVGPGMPVYPQASLVLPSGPSTECCGEGADSSQLGSDTNAGRRDLS